MDATTLTAEQAYEAAYRFVFQYFSREPGSESIMLMLLNMEPTAGASRTNDPASWTSDPASWHDWSACVVDTLSGSPLPTWPQ
jgi:hypothetical protein